MFKADHPHVSRRSRATLIMLLIAGLGVIAFGIFWLWSSGPISDIDRDTTSDYPVTISQQLGIDALSQSLETAMPTGKGIVTGHVESRVKGGYLPAVNASRFDGVTFHPRSGPSTPSGHASSTATILYGPKGLAPGISQVECFATDDWLGKGFLHAYSDQEPELAWPMRLITCSWVSYDFHPASDILLRIDQVVDAQGVVVVAAVNNGRDTKVPPVLGSAYNVIAVGDWNGNSSGGYTTADTAGRCKPDLVAPGGLTSFATPSVAALAARLMETADGLGIDRLVQPALIKAVLMAGADKPAGWRREKGRPLDDHYGAGRPRLDHSYDMLMHQLMPNHVPAEAGWDSRSIELEHDISYRLLLDKPIASISAVLTWQRKVDSELSAFALSRKLRRVYQGRVARMNLKLMRSDTGEFQTLDISKSAIDNVQHVYMTNLPAGRYDLVINRADGMDESWDYVLAWRVSYQKNSVESSR